MIFGRILDVRLKVNVVDELSYKRRGQNDRAFLVLFQ